MAALTALFTNNIYTNNIDISIPTHTHTHPETELPDESIYGVVQSELIRFSRNSSEEPLFMYAAMRMLKHQVRMGYDTDKLIRKVRQFCAKVPSLYYEPNERDVQRRLIKCIRAEQRQVDLDNATVTQANIEAAKAFIHNL